ncbi:wd repeat-containing 78 [Chlorella sorokiniana]|uniref:Dynein axonemal intermediate chain 4 n=1 Tax=Chlorella sorokiniana TaxID=3076 RepID=A0A2P6TLC6_CHLSO|nr:wd repeat-containing 78 [Chlorella sorokiniana]|eukprot:PRW45097.1 wd repeat-containing 78 [Chlorella sorokiniana]
MSGQSPGGTALNGTAGPSPQPSPAPWSNRGHEATGSTMFIAGIVLLGLIAVGLALFFYFVRQRQANEVARVEREREERRRRAAERRAREALEAQQRVASIPIKSVVPVFIMQPDGRYSQTSNHRSSVARAGGGGGGARGRATGLDSSGLPFERIVVIDPEDGRDRTPKPLVAARPQGSTHPDEAWGSSDAGGAADSVGRASSMSFGPALPGVPSARSFLASELGDATLEGGASQDSLPAPPPGLRSGRQSMLHAAAMGGGVAGGGGGALRATATGDGTQRATHSGGRITPLAAGLLELEKQPVLSAEQQDRQWQQEQQEQRGQPARRKHTRSQAVQCASVAHTSRGVQVLPWELRASAAADDAAAEASEAVAGGALGQAAAGAEANAGEGAPEEEEEDALAAMAQQQSVADLRGGGFESHRGSPLGSHRGLHSLSPSRRGSVAGPEASSSLRQPPAAAQSGSVSQLGTGRQQAELPLLWEWRSDLSGELPVSCLAFNRAAPGLVAVGYGRLEFGVEGAGLLAVWSLANPTHPVWHAPTPCGVSALDWSSKAPSCLAAGFFDGSLALYDVRSTGGSHARPVARAPPAGPSGGGHSEPVWRLCHVPKASDPGEEMLVSVSSDGRVLQWAHAQGLEASELLTLRRAQASGREAQGAAAPALSEGLLGRAAGGTCFAFNPADPRTYLVGTEEGLVHRCSTAFSEQGGQAYSGHVAPVYQVCWSPFSPSHFLTASADWTVRLWHEAQPRRPLATLALPGARAEVADAAFCPAAATLLAAAAGNSLQVWDVEQSVLAPRAAATRLGTRFTALAFCQAAPVVVAGADDGTVCVYSLAGLYDAAAAAEAADGDEGCTEHWREQQRQRLEAALRLHTAHHAAE